MPEGSHPTTESPDTTSPGEDLSRALAEPSAAWPDVVLREHQIEALDELAGRLTHGQMRTWVDAPTGSGKTIMFLALAQALGGSTLVLVPRRNLAEQTIAGLARHFTAVPANPEGPESAGRPGVTVCTYQAALRHQDRMDWDSVSLLICDEAHATLGAQTRKLLDRARNAVVVGFTATGATTTGHVEQVFGPVAATLDRMSAIERGILCPLRSLRVERAVDLSDVAKVRGDFDQASLGRALDRARWHRACADVWVEHFQPLKLAGVAYTATVAQAHALAEELTERGVRAAAVSGQTPAKELQRVLFDFASDRIDVLCNADLLTEGWDETRAAVVMHLAPTTSERVFVQRLGRVMRPAPDKEAVSVEFLPAGDPMGVQTSHEVFGLGWYKPLGRVAGPPEGGERGKLARAAALLADREGDSAKLVNPAAAPGLIAAGLADGGWREADPALLPVNLMEEWVQAASFDVTVDELIDRVTIGIDPLAAVPWWALSGLVARRLQDGADQPLWRAWATALLVQPDLRRALPDDVPRRVLDRLRMTSRERLRALWWHADQTDRWERLATLEQLGRSSDRRRRWSALDEASVWAPSWAWDVSRVLADGTRPGRNQEVARIAAWEAHHLISNGGERALVRLLPRRADRPLAARSRRAAAGSCAARRPLRPAPRAGRPPPRGAGPGRRAGAQRAPAPRRARGRRGGGLGAAARLPRRARPLQPGRPPGAAGRGRRGPAEGPPLPPCLECPALAPAASPRARARGRRRGAPPQGGAGRPRGPRDPRPSPPPPAGPAPPPRGGTPAPRRPPPPPGGVPAEGASPRKRRRRRRRPRSAAGAEGSAPPETPTA